eukprot:CAMPEP_0174756768 /NCGR_PEP_ID=MMETSP1094-20130205/106922_1 /TAXON_ID=156173 /ORGANISM="Chrysochromulina brevifilum, Strain UTEX LB 985" /LENGTH=97 /DNA_ID=CAMNT_0015962679 /DNA_START=661 /DNA_END=954 /DNA_ORIENTATION=+
MATDCLLLHFTGVFAHTLDLGRREDTSYHSALVKSRRGRVGDQAVDKRDGQNYKGKHEQRVHYAEVEGVGPDGPAVVIALKVEQPERHERREAAKVV